MTNPLIDDIAALARMLDLPDTDYWYDEGCLQASKILWQGGAPLLAALLEEVEKWNSVQQEHLAYIMGDSAERHAMSLMKKLAASANEDVAFRAREALGNALRGGK